MITRLLGFLRRSARAEHLGTIEIDGRSWVIRANVEFNPSRRVAGLDNPRRSASAINRSDLAAVS